MPRATSPTATGVLYQRKLSWGPYMSAGRKMVALGRTSFTAASPRAFAFRRAEPPTTKPASGGSREELSAER
ncbi:hypothetical protein TYRP_020977 [Tyrophagus putrescentiae]|nr:hypothetical protein TYRP_020977 [Tyrophagus putrescentiae]